jgi:hypothetical protein
MCLRLMLELGWKRQVFSGSMTWGCKRASRLDGVRSLEGRKLECGILQEYTWNAWGHNNTLLLAHLDNQLLPTSTVPFLCFQGKPGCLGSLI